MDRTDYHEFLESKRTYGTTTGIDVPLSAIHEKLFPFQRTLVQWALRKGRAAIFADAGLGKTFVSLEFARLTGQRTLIVAPLSVARQTVSEAKKIGMDVHYTRDGSNLVNGINITNYEMIDHFDPSKFGTVVLDESSILKSINSATRERLIDLFAETPYRLCCTATPAPNDQTEIGNHADFLGVMSRPEMLSTFFIHDSAHGSGTGWRLKGHAREAFYRWMASWSMSVKKPSNLGDAYSDEGYILPPLSVEPVIVGTSYIPDDQLFFTTLGGIQGRSKARKGTLNERVQKAVELVQSNKEQWVLWCGRNDESSALAKAIPDCVEIVGSDSPDRKIAAIEGFQEGRYRVLVTKSSIAGFGINLQNCHNMAFVGISDSFEDLYQSIRRCYRFGQQYPVNVFIILSEIEQEIYANVMRKEQEANIMSEELIASVQKFEQEELNNVKRHVEYKTQTVRNDQYTLMLGDSCERMSEIANESVDLSIFSPPFSLLFTYSPSERDLGNSRSDEEFHRHFGYVIDELLRVTKPGRNACVHVQQLAASLVNDGFIGLKDFRGDVIRAFIERGWIFHGEVTIDRNPQQQAVRTKAKGLLFVQLHKDSSWSRPGLADYIIIFRKPGENAVPIKPDLTNDEWIQWAHPCWYNIRESDTLNVAEGRDNDDERHVAALQLGTIERCVRLWSNPGETIFSPFMGIGSEAYVALKHNRKFVGIELKSSYYLASCKNAERMLKSKTQATLFDFGEDEVAC